MDDGGGMRVLVTGATGFIGFHTAARLASEGHRVRVLVRSLDKAARILDPIGLDAGERIQGDMTNTEAVSKALEGCDAVVHTAAGVSVTEGRSDFDDNLRGTEAIIGGACARGLHAVYLSSVTAIFSSGRPVSADDELVRPRSHYGRSKAQCDAFVRERQREGADVAILYPPGVVGPDDPGLSESVAAYRSFLRGTLQSEGGLQTLDVRDLALLINRMVDARARGRFVPAGHFLDWDGATRMIEDVTGATLPRIKAPGWVIRGAGRAMDVVGRLTGRSMPMTGEGVEIATRFRAMQDTPALARFGVEWRDERETFLDLYQWLLDAGHLKPKAVPALTPRPSG